MQPLKIGLIGLDTSHVTAFTELLNDQNVPYHVPGGRVVAAFPGGSEDFEVSRSRVAGFTEQLRERWDISMLKSPAAVAERCDAILLTSVDGRVHLEQFREIAPYGKPTFIDKPFTTAVRDAEAIIELAREYKVPLMSCSSLRYAAPLQNLLETEKCWVGVDTCEHLGLEPTQPGLFWYGIHAVEILYTVLGRGCVQVSAQTNEQFDLVMALWEDGRMATLRGSRTGNKTFGALLHSAEYSKFVDVYADDKPFYSGLMDAMMPFLQGGQAPVPIDETLEIIRFIEAANESRETGKTVGL